MEQYRLIEEERDPITRQTTRKTTNYYSSREEAYQAMYEELEYGFRNTFQIYSLDKWERIEGQIAKTGHVKSSDRFFLGQNSGFYKNQRLQDILAGWLVHVLFGFTFGLWRRNGL